MKYEFHQSHPNESDNNPQVPDSVFQKNAKLRKFRNKIAEQNFGTKLRNQITEQNFSNIKIRIYCYTGLELTPDD